MKPTEELESQAQTTPFNSLNDEVEVRIDMGGGSELFKKPEPVQSTIVETVAEEDTTPAEEEATSIPGDEGTPNPEEDEGSSTQQPDEADEYEVEVKDNIIALFAKKWVEEGKLPEDFEVTDTTSEQDIEDALYNMKVNNATSESKDDVKAKIFEEEGLTPEIVELAKKQNAGISSEELKQANDFAYLGTVKLDPEGEGYEENVKILGMQFYLDKNFTPEQAERRVAQDLGDDLDIIQKEYQNHFVERARDLAKTHEDKVNEKRKQDQLKREERINLINSRLDQRKIGDAEYTKEQMDYVRKAMFDKTETIVDKNGNRKRVTLEEKKIYESKNDPDKYLKARVDFILGYNVKVAEEDATRRAKRSILNDTTILVKPRKVRTTAGSSQSNVGSQDAGGYEERII